MSNINISKFNPWFITGFCDGESSFTVSVYPDSKSKLKWGYSTSFNINLHIKDIFILEKIQNTWGVGRIQIRKDEPVAEYIVKSLKELEVIIEHFSKYPLMTVKLSNFLLFKQCVDIIKKKEHLTETGLLKILGLKTNLSNGLSDNLRAAFPNINPIFSEEYKIKEINF